MSRTPPDRDATRVATRLNTAVVLALCIAATLGCDRLTKHLAVATLAGEPEQSYLGDTVRLRYVENAGGFLSLGAELPPALRAAVFTAGTGAMLFVLAAVAIHQRWKGLALLGVTLFVTGGASNWIDRVLHGSVVDFLNVGVGPVRTGIFNVADVAILAGAVLVVVGASRLPSAAHGRRQ